MKAPTAVLLIFLLGPLLIQAGCEPTPPQVPISVDPNSEQLFLYQSYTPVSVDIMPLTEFVSGDDAEDGSGLKVYVALLDSFGSQIKSPGIFRFEMYGYVERSATREGKRIGIWPDLDLTGAAENHSYWRDYLRAYEFNLDFEPQTGSGYVVQVTCLCPSGKRLSDHFVLKYAR